MSSFPNSPRLLKGAIVGVDPFNPLASIIVFQYNPETLSRTLLVQGFGESGDHSKALDWKWTAVESIKLEAKIEAMKGRNP